MHVARLISTLVLFVSSVSASRLSRALFNRHAHALTSRENGTQIRTDDLQKRDGTKYVFMHHIVGTSYWKTDTYPYTQADWVDDIQQIKAKGVDALALNIGQDSWQRTQIASAYAAAASLGTDFKLFISFDFTEMSCDANDIASRVNEFAQHPNQFRVDGRPMISSFSGDCLGDSGWASLKAQTNGYLMPFIWGLEGQFGNWKSLDSWFCWGCAWPQGDNDKTADDDQFYIDQLGPRYATTVSGWMYTHYSYKNFFQRADDWLINTRWEQLVAMRDKLTFVEMVTWNDYGESDYFGPVKGALPDGTTWATGFPHTAWYDMSQYYITAFKTGSYPEITQDVIYYWARPHPAGATASGDPLGKPTGYSWTSDYLWAVVFSTSSGTVTLQCGSSSQSFDIAGAGVHKFKIPLAPGQISVAMVKDGQTVIQQTPSDFTYSADPLLYNYNAYVGSAKANSLRSPSPTSPSPAPTTTTQGTPGPTTTSVSGSAWNYLGCYLDNYPRTLNNGFQGTDLSGQSVSTCLSLCASKGYAFGGTEYGVECWCSAAITEGATQVSAGECNMSCSGQGTDICGGGNRISLFAASAVSSSSPEPTPTPTASIPIPSGTGFSYLGCVAEGLTGLRRALTGASFSRLDMTPLLCQSLCSDYQYAGVEYGIECHCGNSLTNNGATGEILPSNNCASPCGGDASSNCGGGWMMSVYSKGPVSPPPPEWTSAGCYTDSPSRLLRSSLSTIPGMTTEKCISTCAAEGHTIAATEYGNQCLCGSQLLSADGAGTPAGSSECNMPCAGNPAEVCGAGWRANVYMRPGTSLRGRRVRRHRAL